MTPIRNVVGNCIGKFKSLNPDVVAVQEQLKRNFDPCIYIDPTPSAFYAPRVDYNKKKIEVAETFLNFLWAFTYFAFVYQESANDLLKTNPSATHLLVTSPEMQNAKALLDFCRDLRVGGYSSWPNGVISPLFSGQPTNDVEDYALKTNGLFSTAVACLLLHEVGHLSLGHETECRLKEEIEHRMEEERTYKPSDDELEPIISAETEADNFALNLVLRLSDEELTKLNNSYGTVIAFCSMLFCTKTVRGVKQQFHPNLHDRVFRAVQRVEGIEVKNEGYFPHFACQAMMLMLDKDGYSLPSYDAGVDPMKYLIETLEEVDKAAEI